MSGPLTGVRVIELAGIGPGPFAGRLLTDMGAEVIAISRPGGSIGDGAGGIDNRGKRSLVLDLRKEGAARIALDLIKTADILIEGNRPGVAERLGLGPEDCHAVNPALVYGRMTGWGQSGPWANVAGHDINYLAITGALLAMGPADRPPSPPLNLVGDYGGGSMFLIAGVLAALIAAQRTGKGDVVDAAIIDGTSSMMGIVYALSGVGMWQERRESNLLDGAMPFYRCYAASCGGYMAVGCIEPQFFAAMLALLEITPSAYGGQHDRSQFAAQTEMLEAKFASKTREDWAQIFDGSDACVTPVLSYEEARSHPQNIARGGLKQRGPFVHPAPAPVFKSARHDVDYAAKAKGADTREILRDLGHSEDDIAALLAAKIINAAD